MEENKYSEKSLDELEFLLKEYQKKSSDFYNTEQGIKLTLNSIYGATGNQYFALFNTDVAESVTLQGQDIWKFAEKIINRYFNDMWHLDTELHEKMGVRNVRKITLDFIIYGDTDSNYINLGAVMDSCEFDSDLEPFEFVKRLNEERLKILKSNDKIQKKNVEKTKQNNDNKKFVKASYDINGNYNSEKIFDKEFNKFQDKCNNIPDYILRNLREMPSNKGYIWKGIWCFGELPAEDTTLIMFEKVNGDLKIYEIDEYNRSIYEKKGKDKKVLISKTPRSDFIKAFRAWAKERGY